MKILPQGNGFGGGHGDGLGGGYGFGFLHLTGDGYNFMNATRLVWGTPNSGGGFGWNFGDLYGGGYGNGWGSRYPDEVILK